MGGWQRGWSLRRPSGTTDAHTTRQPNRSHGTNDGSRARPLLALAMVLVLALGALGGAGGLVGSAAAANHANFVVTNLDTNDPIVEGETLTVDATIENTGASTGTQTVEFSTTPDGVIDTVDLTLDPGETATETFEWVTEDGDAGVPNVDVETANFTSGQEVIIEQGATIDGQVVDAATGEDVDGAMVTFVNATSGVTVATTSTDATGAYTSPPLAANDTEYDVSVSAAGYHTESGTVTLPNSGTTVDVDLLRDLDGEGTESTPYVIHNVAELQSMQNDLDAHYVVANGFDASAAAGWNEGAGFAPIGDGDVPFTGSLDGQGHAISNLAIDRGETDDVGVFGYADGTTITSVTLESVDVSGDDAVGGLIGHIEDGTVNDAHVTGTVGGDEEVGGLVGQNEDGFVTDSTASVGVTGEDEVGGLVGINEGGAVVDSWASGDVEADGDYAGGLIGLNEAAGAQLESPVAQQAVELGAGVVANVSARGDVSGEEDVGGLIGNNVAGVVTNATASGEVTGIEEVGGLIGHNEGFPPIALAESPSELPEDMPGLVADASATGGVTGVDQVGGLAGENSGSGVIVQSHATGSVELWEEAIESEEQDVELFGGLVGENEGGFVVESYATGDVDGPESTGGLVGGNLEAGTVASSYATGDVSSEDDVVGGLVGENTEDATITRSYATGTVVGDDAVGGLVGWNNDGALIASSYAVGSVTGDDPVGGLVGDNSGATIERSYATGEVTGDDAGGLVGLNGGEGGSGEVVDSYWDVQSTGQSTSDGDGTGLDTAQMTGDAATANVTGFDFGETWTTTDSYPVLDWSITDYELALGESNLETGDTTDATVTVSLVDGRSIAATDVSSYESSDATVATAAAGATVDAVGVGGADVTATHAAYEDSVQVSVQDPSGGGSGGSASDIAVSDLSAPGSSTVGEPVDVTVTLSNGGDASGDYVVTVTLDGEEIASHLVSVDAGSDATLTVTESFDEPGTYTFSVEDFDATVEVAEQSQDGTGSEGTEETEQTEDGSDETETSAPTPTDDPGGAPEPDGNEGGLPLLPLLALLVIAILIAAGYLWARES